MEAGRSDLVYGVGEGSPEDQEAERRGRSYLDKEVGWGKRNISRGNSLCRSPEVGGSMVSRGQQGRLESRD